MESFRHASRVLAGLEGEADVTLEFERRLTRDWDDPAVIGLDGYVAKGGYARVADGARS